MHKQIYYITSSALYIQALSCAHVGKLQISLKISAWSVKNQFDIIFDALANNIYPV